MGNKLANAFRVFDEDCSQSESDDNENDVSINDEAEPIDQEDYVMSEASSLRDNFQEEEQEEKNGFHVGDFVWVKEVNSQQWWVGQIYDSSNASDLALKTKQKGKLLVVYFGDKDFAWCNPLELKPFLENFKEFSKMSDTKSVEEAVRKIGEQVEKFLVCDDHEAALVSSVAAVNSGVKEGVVVPDVRREIVSSLVLENHPGVVLDDVQSLAKKVCFSDLLEIEVLKRRLSVFYRSKGRFGLDKFDEVLHMIGLDEYKEGESGQRLLRKCSRFGMKKRKFGFGDVATTGSASLRWRKLNEISKIETTHEEKISNGKSSSSRKRKSKSGFDDNAADDDEVGKIEESNDSNHLEGSEKKHESGIDLATPSASHSKRLKVDVVSSSVEKKNGNGETLVITGKRERKKSKYLSPEYMTDYSWRLRKIKKAIDFVIRLGDKPEEILKLIRASALSTQDYNSSGDMLREFASIYRSFTYHDGAYNKIQIRDLLAEVKQEVVDEPNETVDEKQFSGVELFIKTDDLGSTLPSRDDLIKVYKKFGALDMKRSYIFDNNSVALVAFSNVSDGEEAYKKSLEKCPFATTSTITFNLKKYPPPSSEKKKEAEKRKSVIEIEFLKEKLKEIKALLDQSDGGITEELKMKLEDESRNLLDKVSNMIVPSS